MSFPDLRRWLGGHKATEDRAGLSSVSLSVVAGDMPPRAPQGLAGMSRREVGRGGLGRRLAESGGLCPSWDPGCFRLRAKSLCRRQLLKGQITERKGI